MRWTALLGLATLTAALALHAAPASAQGSYRLYPWCAQYNLPGGPTSCRFSTFEQCRPEVSGVGGQCVVNPYYAAYGPHHSFRGGPPPRRSARKNTKQALRSRIHYSRLLKTNSHKSTCRPRAGHTFGNDRVNPDTQREYIRAVKWLCGVSRSVAGHHDTGRPARVALAAFQKALQMERSLPRCLLRPAAGAATAL